VATSSSRVTGSAGTSAFAVSAPVGATVISVRARDIPAIPASSHACSHRATSRARAACRRIHSVRAVVQRVREASVTVDGRVVARIDRPGLCLLVAVTHDDTAAHAARLAAKVHELRILRGEQSAAETGAPLLVVSQFTLYGDTRKGRRPTWNAAAPGEQAEPLVDAVVAELRARGAEVATGVFGADMLLALVNDGPVTLLVEV
jgi:D-tyrosyl-tRNA(Tyr) deacylase